MITRAVMLLAALLMPPLGAGLAANGLWAPEVHQAAAPTEPGSGPDSGSGGAEPDERAERNMILVMIEQPPNRQRPGAAYSSGYGSAQTQAARERLGRTIASAYKFEFVELWPMPLLGLDCLVIRFSDQYSAAEAARIVAQHPMVAWAEPIDLYETMASVPQPKRRGDPLAALSPTTDGWDLPRLHASWTGRDVTVAIIDTQVDVDHPDLAGRIKAARNFAPQAPARPEFHGTEVAGIVAANAGNGIGIAGVAPEARILALRACWQRGASRSSTCTSLNLARAMNYAIERGAKVINLSLGGPPSRLLGELIDTASRRGIAVVAAYDPALPMGGFPASHPNVIAVAQVGVSAGRGYVAPGKDIPTTQPGGGFHFVSGSSYSAAHVSGLLALRYQRSRNQGGPWRALSRTRSESGEIDIAASFD